MHGGTARDKAKTPIIRPHTAARVHCIWLIPELVEDVGEAAAGTTARVARARTAVAVWRICMTVIEGDSQVILWQTHD